MGKKQHSKDRMYITATEWKYEFGGHKEKKSTKYAALEFDRCALSFQPFLTPVSTKEGFVFDILNIVPFIKKHKVNPCTGTRIATKNLIRLHFKKNTDDKYCCPMTYKVFGPNTHIVFIKQSGNVYCMEAVQELNVKAKHWQDLISGEDFEKKDIISIQDPTDVKRRTISAFHHVANDIVEEDDKKESMGLSDAAKRVLNKVDPEAVARAEKGTKTKAEMARIIAAKKEKIAEGPRSQYSDKRYSASLTSTTLTPFTNSEKRLLTEAEILELRYKQLTASGKKGPGEKAFLRMMTSHGNINLQLEVDLAPKTCHNFLLLVKKGYYKDILFHRMIKDFMIQGGDPTGTGRGGECAWGGKFRDEFHPSLSHESRGLLSMANAGSHTNGSQFFMTFGACKHLDNKHTIFGKVVGGFDVLMKMENVEVGRKGPGHNARYEKDRPTEDVTIRDFVIYKNPFDEPFVLDEDKKKKQTEEPEYTSEQKAVGNWFSAPQAMNIPTAGAGISRFLDAVAEEPEKKKKKKSKKDKKRKRGEDGDAADDLDSITITKSATGEPTEDAKLKAKAMALASMAKKKDDGFSMW